MRRKRPRPSLKAEYEDFLAQYGVAPRTTDEAFRDFLAYAEKVHDTESIKACRLALERPAPPHPAQMILEDTAAWVERAIRSERGRRALPRRVYIGEFPIGSVNALATVAVGGFIVLVNSGLLTLMRQVPQALCLEGGFPDEEILKPRVLDTLAAIVRAYVEYDDPLYGPTPLAPGLMRDLCDGTTSYCQRFVVAHEYAHILRGHFDHQDTAQVGTKVGSVDALTKSREQEFEADREAYELLLATAHARRAAEPDSGVSQLHISAAVAAPFVTLQIFDLITVATERLGRKVAGSEVASHPSPVERMRPLYLKVQDMPEIASGSMGYAYALATIQSEVLARAESMTYPRFLSLVRECDIAPGDEGTDSIEEMVLGRSRDRAEEIGGSV